MVSPIPRQIKISTIVLVSGTSLSIFAWNLTELYAKLLLLAVLTAFLVLILEVSSLHFRVAGSPIVKEFISIRENEYKKWNKSTFKSCSSEGPSSGMFRELHHLVDLIVRDFVELWYKEYISRNNEFVQEVKGVLILLFARLSKLAVETRLPLVIINDSLLMLQQQLRKYKEHKEAVRLKHTGINDGLENISSMQMSDLIAQEMALKGDLHPALLEYHSQNANSIRKLQHLRQLSMKFVSKLASEGDLCLSLSLLVREIIACQILTPVIENITPSRMNSTILDYFGNTLNLDNDTVASIPNPKVRFNGICLGQFSRFYAKNVDLDVIESILKPLPTGSFALWHNNEHYINLSVSSNNFVSHERLRIGENSKLEDILINFKHPPLTQGVSIVGAALKRQNTYSVKLTPVPWMPSPATITKIPREGVEIESKANEDFIESKEISIQGSAMSEKDILIMQFRDAVKTCVECSRKKKCFLPEDNETICILCTVDALLNHKFIQSKSNGQTKAASSWWFAIKNIAHSEVNRKDSIFSGLFNSFIANQIMQKSILVLHTLQHTRRRSIFKARPEFSWIFFALQNQRLSSYLWELSQFRKELNTLYEEDALIRNEERWRFIVDLASKLSCLVFDLHKKASRHVQLPKFNTASMHYDKTLRKAKHQRHGAQISPNEIPLYDTINPHNSSIPKNGINLSREYLQSEFQITALSSTIKTRKSPDKSISKFYMEFLIRCSLTNMRSSNYSEWIIARSLEECHQLHCVLYRQHSGLNIIFPNNGLEIAKEEADPRAVLRLFRDMKSYFAQIASLPFEVYSQQLLDFLCPNSYDISRFGERIEMNVVNCALIQEAPFFQFNSKLRRNPDFLERMNTKSKRHFQKLQKNKSLLANGQVSMSDLENNMYELFYEVFGIVENDSLRKHVLKFVRVIFRLSFGRCLFRPLEQGFSEFAMDEIVIRGLRFFREHFWLDGLWQKSVVETTSQNEAEEELKRAKALAAIISLFPNSLASLLGKEKALLAARNLVK